jgi:predicted aldo/keto reductase-like oxidoreductase
MAARMKYLLGRMRRDIFLSEDWQANMRKIDDCTGCGHCAQNCPYELDVPALLRHHREEYLKCL